MISTTYAQKVMEKDYIGEKKQYFGAAYYPEVWDWSEIDKDIAHMKELNMNVVRMAEFAWAKMEPQEGKYDFKWLHNIIDKLHANGISVILGTPTATPPAWMWEKYPEIALTHYDGSKTKHGIRRDCSYTNATYRKKSVMICEKMAQEFANKPGVIGWQTDNEFSLTYDYSAETKRMFIGYLKNKYKTIENINKAWSLDLWSMKYDKFEQIVLPDEEKSQWMHPSLRYEWVRFSNDMVTEYQDLQINALRKYTKLPITHDGMPGQRVDYEKLFKRLDYMAINNYHSFEAYDLIVSNYDRMRGYGKGFHWLFETAPNFSGGGGNPTGQVWFLHQPKGSMRAALWMNHALGAQGSMYWLWRQHPAGQEMVHGAVLHSWGKPMANYNDIKQLGSELAQTSDFMMNNPVSPADIAVVYSHEAHNAFQIEQTVNGIKYYSDWTYRFYLPFHDAYLHRDVIAPSHDISKYKMIYVPLMPYMPEEFKTKLKKWVNEGGTLVMGPVVGYRNEYLGAETKYGMGNLEEWTDISLESRIPIGLQRRDAEVPLMLEWNKSVGLATSEAAVISDALATKTGEVLCTYKTGMHDGKPAIVKTKIGKGNVVMLGTDPGRAALKTLMTQLAKEQGITPVASGDKGLIIVPRKGISEGKIIVNITNETKYITLPETNLKDILTGENKGGLLKIAPYDVLILQK
jgi:beta-galactosidase GanA